MSSYHLFIVRAAVGAVLFVVSSFSSGLKAHGFEGDRFFPPTIQFDDPFAADEFALPTITVTKPTAYNDAPRVTEVDVNGEFVKEIFPKFAVGVSGTYIHQGGAGTSTVQGFDNVSLSTKYQLWEIPAHEWILSLGGEVDLGGTGSQKLGVESYSTYTPTLYFGKGMGDLPSALKYLRPIALTGTLGVSLPGRSSDPDTLNYDWALEYDMSYLQQHVENIGMPHFLERAIPIVEFAFSTPMNRGYGRTTGSICPGVLYELGTCQIGAEAIVPVNGQTARATGAVVSVQIYIDDLFPKIFGHPIFFGKDQP